MMALGDIAASLNLPVFPCNDGKQPIVATGFKAATKDRAHILAAFDRPGAAMIGVPTGAASGWVVIDVDVKEGHDGRVWLADHADALPQTRTHKTRSGGLHLIFNMPATIDIRNSSGRVASGVDVRGTGGYVIVPPSPGYSVADDIEPADMPAWLVRACLPVAHEQKPRLVYQAVSRDSGGTAYGLKALAEECASIRSAPFGQQEDTLNSAALKIGALVAGGELEEGIALADLRAAGNSMGSESGRDPWTPDEIDSKVRRGMKHGSARPRAPAPRTPPIYTDPPSDDAYWRVVEADIDYSAPAEDAPPPPAPEHPTVRATALRSRDLTAIPPRRWIYGRELIRGFVSVLGSPGGTGKTAFLVGVALAVITGRPLLATEATKSSPFKAVHKTGNVWLYNLEDPADELDRRIQAALVHHNIPFEDVADRLFVDSGRDHPLVITQRIAGALVRVPLVDELIKECLRLEITVLVIDPFVQSHTAEENRNEEMNFVMALWGEVAHHAKCSVWLIHHFRKGGQAADAESFRGAAAIQGAARVMSTLATMSQEEAGKLNIDDADRWQYVRRDNAKANMAPRAMEAEWIRLVSVHLDNGDDEYPLGDSVQTIEPWEPPSAWDGMPWSVISSVLTAIERGPADGEYYAAGKQSGDRWVVRVVMDKAGRTEAQASTIIKAWLDAGVLETGRYSSPAMKGRETGCVRANAAKVAEMRRSIVGEIPDAI